MSDADLIGAARDGDADAFAVLMRRHYPDCLRFAVRLTGSEADAEDAVQETFIRAYRSLHGYRDRQRFRAWLLQILRNRCITLIARRASRFERLEGYAATARESVEPVHSNGTHERVQAALQMLPPKLREAFLLRFVEQLDYAEMRAVTGTSVPALKMRVNRARTALQQLLGDRDE